MHRRILEAAGDVAVAEYLHYVRWYLLLAKLLHSTVVCRQLRREFIYFALYWAVIELSVVLSERSQKQNKSLYTRQYLR